MLALLCLTGCQLVFAPDATQPDAAVALDAELDAPSTSGIALALAFDQPSPVLAGTTRDVAISITGQPGRQVYLSVAVDPPSAGSVMPVEPIVLGSVTTIAHTTFTAGSEFIAGRVSVVASYERDLRNPELGDIPFELHQPFGNTGSGSEQPMPGATLFAYPIDVPKAGEIASVTLFGAPSTASVRVAVYTDMANRPGLLISESLPPAHLLAESTAVETTFAITPVNVDTRFWLVLVADRAITIDANLENAGVPFTAVTNFADPFPGLFPPGASSHSQAVDFRYYVNIGP